MNQNQNQIKGQKGQGKYTCLFNLLLEFYNRKEISSDNKKAIKGTLIFKKEMALNNNEELDEALNAYYKTLNEKVLVQTLKKLCGENDEDNDEDIDPETIEVYLLIIK
jgi:hypothetical protein